jgi:hypothetical protein
MSLTIEQIKAMKSQKNFYQDDQKIRMIHQFICDEKNNLEDRAAAVQYLDEEFYGKPFVINKVVVDHYLYTQSHRKRKVESDSLESRVIALGGSLRNPIKVNR